MSGLIMQPIRLAISFNIIHIVELSGGRKCRRRVRLFHKQFSAIACSTRARSAFRMFWSIVTRWPFSLTVTNRWLLARALSAALARWQFSARISALRLSTARASASICRISACCLASSSGVAPLVGDAGAADVALDGTVGALADAAPRAEGIAAGRWRMR